MTETPTHTIEIYLQDDRTLTGPGRTERYFYGDEAQANGAYEQLVLLIDSRVKRENYVPLTMEVTDLYGRGLVIVGHLTGVRLYDSAALDAWGMDQRAALEARVARAKHDAVADDPGGST